MPTTRSAICKDRFHCDINNEKRYIYGYGLLVLIVYASQSFF